MTGWRVYEGEIVSGGEGVNEGERVNEAARVKKSYQVERLDGLLDTAQKGSGPALDELTDAFAPLLLAACRRYRIHGALDVDDLRQEAYLAFVDAVRDFDPTVGAPFPAFAKQRVYARMWTLVRREQTWQGRRQTDLIRGGDEPLAALDTLSDPASEKILAEVLFTLDIRFSLSVLSPRERLALKAIVNQLPLRDLALQTGVSLETAKTWRKRALQKLRKLLGQEWQ